MATSGRLLAVLPMEARKLKKGETMTLNLKILGFALVAVLVLSAVAAQAAFAGSDFNSKSPTKNTNLIGNQTVRNVFSVNTGNVKCEKAEFTSTQTGNEVSAISVHPLYEECRLAGQDTTVATTGCNYEFRKVGAGSSPNSTSVKIICSSAPITVSKESCTLTVGSQESLDNVKMENLASSSEVLATAEINSNKSNSGVSSITYQESSSTCSSEGSHTNGTYTGAVRLRGTVDPGGGATEIFVS